MTKTMSAQKPILLRFSDAVTEDATTLSDKIKVRTSGGTDIPVDISIIDGGRSLKLNTNGALSTGSDYSVSFSEPLKAEGGRTINTPAHIGESGIQFETRGSYSGSAGLANTAEEFSVAWKVPASDDQSDQSFEALNFSTFRFSMTQPVHPNWQAMGGSIELLDKDANQYPQRFWPRVTGSRSIHALHPSRNNAAAKTISLTAVRPTQ